MIRAHFLPTLLLFLLAGSCDISKGGGQTIFLSNKTASAIVLEKVSSSIELTTPTSILAGQELSLSNKTLSYLEFSVTYNGTRYSGDSGNSDDYSSYRLELYDSGGDLKCRFSANGTADRDIALVEAE